MTEITGSRIHFRMPTFRDAMRHHLRVAVDVYLTPGEWDRGRRAILEVLRAFFDLKEVTRWEEAPTVLFVPRAGTKFCLLLRFRHAPQAAYLKAMLCRAAEERGWLFDDDR